MVTLEKNQGFTEVTEILPLGNMNVFRKFHGRHPITADISQSGPTTDLTKPSLYLLYTTSVASEGKLE